MKPIKKYDVFPLEPYRSKGKSVFSMIVNKPQYVKHCMESGVITLTAEAREALEKFLMSPMGDSHLSSTGLSGTVEVSGRIVHCTLHAVLFENEYGQAWIPSQFFDIDESRTTGPEETVAFVPQWVAVQKGLV